MKKEKAKRSSFVFYDSFAQAIQMCPEKDQLELFKGIADYALNYKEHKFQSTYSQLAWALIKPQLDANWSRYLNGCKGAVFGGKGGNPNFKKGQTNPYYHKHNPEDIPEDNPKITPNENVNVNENVNENNNGGTGRETVEKKPVSTSRAFKKPSIGEVSAYIQEIGASIDASDFVDFYDSKGWMVGSNHMKDWKAAVRTWQRKRLNNMTEKTPSQTQTEDPHIASFKSWAALNTPYIYSRMKSHDFYEIKRIAESKAVSQILSLMEKDHFVGEILPEFKNRYSQWEAGALK